MTLLIAPVPALCATGKQAQAISAMHAWPSHAAEGLWPTFKRTEGVTEFFEVLKDVRRTIATARMQLDVDLATASCLDQD